jgi:hypothetical protein
LQALMATDLAMAVRANLAMMRVRGLARTKKDRVLMIER